MAPVCIGARADLELDVPLPPAAAALDVAWAAPPPIIVVGVGMPLVKGTEDTLEAPENSGICVEAVATGIADVAFGFRTL